jgi:hypothetical protein
MTLLRDSPELLFWVYPLVVVLWWAWYMGTEAARKRHGPPN